MNVTTSPSLGATTCTPLPELIGTPKQIAWANEIRADFLKMAAKRSIPTELIAKFTTVTNSGWWIDYKPRATSFAAALISALYGKLITVATKNEWVARYSGEYGYQFAAKAEFLLN